MIRINLGINPRAAVAVAAMAVMLGGCATERFSFGRSGGGQDAGAQQQAPAAWAGGAQQAPAGRVTDAPVGAGINIPPGSNEDFIVSVGRRVFFTEGSAQLTTIAQTTLDNQAAWLGRFPKWGAKIQGFSDDPGSDEANRALGMQRAEAVKSYLIAKGVAASRLRAKTYGRDKDRIVRVCPDASCKAQNRRVITNLEGDGDR